MAYGFLLETRNLVRALATSAFTASPGPSDATRSRLNDKRIDKPFVMASTTTGITLAVDLGSAASPDTAALLNHNFASVGAGSRSITVEGADDALFSVNLVACAVATLDSTTSRPKDTCFSWAPVSRRYWRFIFAWTGGGSAAISVGEIVLGVATSISRGELDGSGETERDMSPVVELANGGTSALFLAGPVLERSLVFADFTEAQMATLRTMWRDCKGPVVPVLWCESWAQTATMAVISAAAQKCLYGHLQMPEFGWRWSDFALVKPPDLIIRSMGREMGA